MDHLTPHKKAYLTQARLSICFSTPDNLLSAEMIGMAKEFPV